MLTGKQRLRLLESARGRPEEEAVLAYDWRNMFARENQIPPQGDWFTWLILAGRGFGKTRTGAEWVREMAERFPGCRIALVAPTAGDARDTMVEGESGIIACCPPWFRPKYEPSKRRLTWPNGSTATTFSAEEPERLRGPQHHFAWADELCAWQYLVDTWDMLMFGLRLEMFGRPEPTLDANVQRIVKSSPQVCVTTTPKPVKKLRELVADPTTVVVKGRTTDNKANLAATFYRNVVKVYDGTRIGRQELDAEILDDNQNGLWSHELIDAHRVKEELFDHFLSNCTRIVVGVDPAVTSNEESAETGIIVAGRIGDDAYVFRDLSLHGSPLEWANAVANGYRSCTADRVIGEVNNGGDLVEVNLRTVEPDLSYSPVRASRGKIVRAEPIAALYEQGRVHHVGCFPVLEDQMVDYNPLTDPKSPDRMDALVWALTHLFEGQLAEPRMRKL